MQENALSVPSAAQVTESALPLEVAESEALAITGEVPRRGDTPGPEI